MPQGVPEQGVKILGIPAGQPGLVRLFFEKKSEQKLLRVRKHMMLVPKLEAPVDAKGSQVTASLPFTQGGFVRSGVHWASWADRLRMVRQRHLGGHHEPSEVVSTPSPSLSSPVGRLSGGKR